MRIAPIPTPLALH